MALWPRAQSGVVYDCWRVWYWQRVPLVCLWQLGCLAGVILEGMQLIVMVYLLYTKRVSLCIPAKFYILQPALERLAGRARPGALVVGRELAQVVP